MRSVPATPRRAGFPSAAALVSDLRGDATLPVTRVAFHLVDEPDPRAELAATAELSSDEVADIDRRLARLDTRSANGAWTRATLDAIAARPGTRASGPRGIVRPRDSAVQDRRAQAQEPRAHDQPRDGLSALAAGCGVPLVHGLTEKGLSMAYKMSDDERRAFLIEGTRTAKVATTRADGRPHVAPVWFVLDGDDVIFNTGAGSVKGKSLRRDPRVSLTVDDEQEPFAFVVVDGIAEISHDHDEMVRWATAIGAATWAPTEPRSSAVGTPAPEELLVRVRPSHIVAIGGMTD